MTTLNRCVAALAATLFATPAAAQKGDRYPDPDLDGPRVVRTIPITRDMVIQLVAMTLLPVVPLLLTMISLEDLFKQFLKVVF